ncbi:MAG: DUF2339 domain-containing protein [Planctomycetaceae bacterium]|nr:DUF2339 domain-containing protein [Planctomycetaceae bacterium]
MSDQPSLESLAQVLENLRQMREKLYDLERQVLSMRAQAMNPPPAAAAHPKPPAAPVPPPILPAATQRDERIGSPVPPAAAPPQPPRVPQAPAAAEVFPPLPAPAKAAPKPPASPAPAPACDFPPRPRVTLEQRIGTRWMLMVGIAILLVGGFLFYRYAVEHKWINPLTRCIMGVIWGLAMIGVAEWTLRKQMRYFAAAVFGGGIVWLYTTFYVASPSGLFAEFRLIGTEAAFAAMCGVTALGMVLALRSNMVTTALISLIGAIITPILLSTGVDRQLALMTYLIVINAGFLSLALYKRWQWLAPIALAGTVVLVAGWTAKFYDGGQLTSQSVLAWVLAAEFAAFLLVAAMRDRADSALLNALLPIICAIMLVNLWALCGKTAAVHWFAIGTLAVLAGATAWARWREAPELAASAVIVLGISFWLWAMGHAQAGVGVLCVYGWLIVLAALAESLLQREAVSPTLAIAAGAITVLGWLMLAGQSSDLGPSLLAMQLLALDAVVLTLCRAQRWQAATLAPLGWTVVAVAVAASTLHWPMWHAITWMWVYMGLFVLQSVLERGSDRGVINPATFAIAGAAMAAGFVAYGSGLTDAMFLGHMLALAVVAMTLCWVLKMHALRLGVLGWTAAAMGMYWLAQHDAVAATTAAGNLNVLWSTFIWILFAIFIADVLLRAAFKRGAEVIDGLQSLGAMAMMFTFTYLLLDGQYHKWMGLYAGGLTVFCTVLTVMLRRLWSSALMGQVFLAQALVLAALAIPIQFDRSLVTVGWATEALVAMAMAKRLHVKMIMLMSLAVLALAVIHYAGLDFRGDADLDMVLFSVTVTPISLRLLLGVGLSAVMLACAGLLGLGGGCIDSEETDTALALILTAGGAIVFYTVTLLTIPALSATCWWLAMAAALAALAIWKSYRRMAVIAVLALGAVAVKWACFDTLGRRLSEGADIGGMFILNTQLLLGLAIAAAVTLIWHIRKADWPWLGGLTTVANLAGALLVAWAGCFEVDRWLAAGGGTEFLWSQEIMGWSLWLAAWSTILIVLGFAFKRAEVRYLALGMLLLAVITILVRILKDADTIWQILSFMGLGILLVAGAWIYSIKFRPAQHSMDS